MIRQPRNIAHFALKLDQTDMSKPFEKEFTELVENKEGFLEGTPSILLTGKTEVWKDADIAAACLARGGYNVYKTTPHDILRRMDSKPIWSSEEDDALFAHATVYFIFEVFHTDHSPSISEMVNLSWFMVQHVQAGGVIVIPVDDSIECDLNQWGEPIGDLIEQHFIRITTYGTTTKKRNG